MNPVLALDLIDRSLPDIAPSDVPGRWDANHDRALADARRLVAQIDFSKPNIVIWVPGTDNHAVHPALARQLGMRIDAARTGTYTLDYEASWDVRHSMSTGLRTLRLVLAAIKARGAGNRVLLAGESQGALLIGEAITDPRLAGVVTRAAIVGHPANARHHFEDGHDRRVLEINNPLDKITMPPWGSMYTAMEGVVALRMFSPSKLPTVIAAAVQNPLHLALTGAELLRERLPMAMKGLIPNPHEYSNRMADVAAWLAGGAA